MNGTGPPVESKVPLILLPATVPFTVISTGDPPSWTVVTKLNPLAVTVPSRRLAVPSTETSVPVSDAPFWIKFKVALTGCPGISTVIA